MPPLPTKEELKEMKKQYALDKEKRDKKKIKVSTDTSGKVVSGRTYGEGHIDIDDPETKRQLEKYGEVAKGKTKAKTYTKKIFNKVLKVNKVHITPEMESIPDDVNVSLWSKGAYIYWEIVGASAPAPVEKIKKVSAPVDKTKKLLEELNKKEDEIRKLLGLMKV